MVSHALSSDAVEVTRSGEPESIYVSRLPGGAVTVARHPPSEADVLIELHEPPLAVVLPGLRAKPLTLTGMRAQRRKALDRLSDTVVALENRHRGRRGQPPLGKEIVRHSYTDLFHGLAARVSPETVEALRELPEVRRVVPDREVRSLLDSSVSQVQADRVWEEMGATGQGVTVAIIDSGIDYTHPDLGGCLGLGCKVAGGHDFVNDDADPFDDTGHGTHVAGIIAADGLVRGVAPNARLLAYKVLGPGIGLSSDTLAALERILDPDGDPATDDAPDIVNLSLGISTGPDYPTSLAADLAVDAGIVVIAAAGNTGPGWGTVVSPANARRAIAVGSVDDSDGISSFSARGPAPNTHDIKPELVAPGVGILSTVPSGHCALCDSSGYLALDGTSMAAPHVAGAAALLRELHPGWSADQIGAALILGAVDLSLDTFTAGSGRLDAFAAAMVPAIAAPPTLGFGLVDREAPALTLQKTVTVTNLSAGSGTFTFEAPAAPRGANIAVHPSSSFLAPLQSVDLQVELQIENTMLATLADPPHAYELTLEIRDSTSGVQRLPLTFLKGPILKLRWDEAPLAVALLDSAGDPSRIVVVLTPGLEEELLLPAGMYDIKTLFFDGNIWVFREDVSVVESTLLEIERAEAIHSLTLSPVDENGDTLAPLKARRDREILLIRHKPTMADSILPDISEEIGVTRVSDVSDAFLFELTLLIRRSPEGPSYSIHAFQDQGIDSSRVMTNNPDLYRLVDLHHHVPPDLSQVQSLDFMYVLPAQSPHPFVTGKCSPPLEPPFIERRFESPAPYPEFSLGFLSKHLHLSPGEGLCDFLGASSISISNPFRAESPTRLAFFEDLVTPSFSTTIQDLPLGVGPHYWSGQLQNTQSSVHLLPTDVLRDQLLGQQLPDEIPWQVFQSGIPVAQGTFSQVRASSYNTSIPLSLSAGVYELHVEYTHFLGGMSGHAEAEMLFDLSASDKNPPFLERFELLAEGTWTDVVPPDGAQVLFTVADDSNAFSDVTLLLNTGAGPTPLTLTAQGDGAFRATLPSHGVDPGDPLTVETLELIATDLTGNRLTNRFELPLDPGSRMFADGFESGDVSAWTAANVN